MRKIYSAIYHLGQYLKSKSRATTVAVIGLSILIILFFIPKLKVNFDIGLMSQEGRATSIIDDYTRKGQNRFSIIFATKSKLELTPENACLISSTLRQLKHHFSNIQITSPFNLSVPYESEGRLLFRALLEADCYNIPSKLDFSDFHKYKNFKHYTNDQNSDLRIDFSLGEKQLSSVETSKIIEKIQEFINSSQLKDSFNIYFEGSPVNLSYIQKILAGDLKVNLIFIISFVAIFMIFFNSIRLSLVYLASMLFPMAVLIPLYYFFDLSLNPLSACVFIILAISSIEDFVFLVCHNDRQGEYDYLKFIEPSFYTSLTTMVGFSSLATSEIRDVVGFGLLCALGALLEWISVFVFAPSFIAFFNVKNVDHNTRGLKIISKISSFKFKSNLLIVSFILFGLGIFFGLKMKVDEDLDALFFKDHQYFAVKNYMASTGRFEKKLYVLGKEKDLLNLKSYLKGESLIESTEVYDDITRELAQSLSPEVSRFFKSELEDTNFYKTFHVDEFNVAIISLKKSKLSDIVHITNKINSHCPNSACTLFGKNADFAKYSKEILDTLYNSFGISFILNGVILVILCYSKKQKQYLWVIYSSFWGPVTMFLFLYLLNVPLNFVTCIFVSIMLGLTGDNAIQYLFHDPKLHQASVEKVGIASLVTATFSIVGSLVLSLSGFRFTAFLGPIFALGFAINIFGDLFLLKTGIKSPKN